MKSESLIKSEPKSGNDSAKTNLPSEDTQKKIEYHLERKGGRTRCVCRELEEEQSYWATKRQIEEELS